MSATFLDDMGAPPYLMELSRASSSSPFMRPGTALTGPWSSFRSRRLRVPMLKQEALGEVRQRITVAHRIQHAQ